MKRISEWLQWDKDQGYGWAEAAIKNYKAFQPMDTEQSCLSEALILAFPFSPKPGVIQKEDWYEIFQNLEDQGL